MENNTTDQIFGIDYQLGFYCQPVAATGKAGHYVLESLNLPASCWWRLESSSNYPAEAGFTLKMSVNIKYAMAGTMDFQPGPVNVPLGDYHQRPDDSQGPAAPNCTAVQIIANKNIDINESLSAINPPTVLVTNPKKNYAKARHKG